MEENNGSGFREQRATFVVQIQFRENATWQGTVQWAEKKQSLNFRSALELIRIMDSANETGEAMNTEAFTERHMEIPAYHSTK